MAPKTIKRTKPIDDELSAPAPKIARFNSKSK